MKCLDCGRPTTGCTGRCRTCRAEHRRKARSKIAGAPQPTRQCPHCGTVRDVDDAHLYECPKCGTAGFDCCVPGRNTLCWDCDKAATG
jgi:hypothetical protein